MFKKNALGERPFYFWEIDEKHFPGSITLYEHYPYPCPDCPGRRGVLTISPRLGGLHLTDWDHDLSVALEARDLEAAKAEAFQKIEEHLFAKAKAFQVFRAGAGTDIRTVRK